MIKKILREIEKLEALKDKLEKEKKAIDEELSKMDTKLKGFYACKKQYDKLEVDFNAIFGIDKKQTKEASDS